MAHFQRLIFLALVMLAAWLPASSYASFPATQTNAGACTVAPCYLKKLASANYGTFTGATVNDAALSMQSAYNALGLDYLIASFSVSGNTASFIENKRSTGAYYTTRVVTASDVSVAPAVPAYSCSAGAALSGSTCTCQAPTSLQIGTDASSTCVSPDAARCDATKGGSDLFTGYSSFPAFGSAYCPNNGTASGCGATISGGFAGVKNGVKSWTYEVKYTGVPCTPPPVGDPGVGKETTCKGTEGVVNGVTVCVPASKNDTNVVESEKKDTAADGTTTTEQDEVTCNSTKCTTTKTITTTPPGGTPTTKVVTSEEPKEDYCTKNPRASMCLTSSFSGSSCNTPPVCDGDAIQCAIAAQILKVACALSPELGDSDADYKAAKAKPLASVTGDLAGNSTVSIGPGNFDQSDALGGGSCIADRSISVMGHPLVIPLSRVCSQLALLGNALLVFSFLLAGRIVVRG